MKIYYYSKKHGFMCDDKRVKCIMSHMNGFYILLDSNYDSDDDRFFIPTDEDIAKAVIGLIPKALLEPYDKGRVPFTPDFIFIDIDALFEEAAKSNIKKEELEND